MMKKETILLIVIAFVAGLLVAVIFANINNSQPASEQIANQQPAQPAPSVDFQQQIKTLEAIVAEDPANRQAWVQLGHRYFDAKNPMKAIEAYDKALAIDGNDPDVLTDQAIMFRQLGWYEKAIETFQQANKLNPEHGNSLFNMGIVYMQDLGDNEKAIEAFRRFLVLVPTGPSADRAKRMIAHMDGGHD
jgi:cytochrome c-type biogenesis protein CcmH/NrfG